MNSWDFPDAKNGLIFSKQATGGKVRKKCLNIVPNAHCRVPLCAPISELKSWDFVHAKNGLTCPKQATGSKVRRNVLILVLMRIAAFFCVRRYQNWIPEILNYQKMVSHAQIGLQRPEIAFSLLYRGKWPNNKRLRDMKKKNHFGFFSNLQGSLHDLHGGHIKNFSP